MTLPPSFRADYVEAASAFVRFTSHDQMERYHAVNWALKLDKALGMPWTLYRITPSVALRFSFSGASLNLKPEGLRFAPAVPVATAYDAKMFDNLARSEAAHKTWGVTWYAHDLRGFMRGDRPIKHDPNFVPAMVISDMDKPPTAEDWAEHRAKHKARMAERIREDEAFLTHINRHNPAETTGAQAFYTDMQLHMQKNLADPAIPGDVRPYYEWISRYLEQKAAGKPDQDILPLRLDLSFPELAPKPRRSGPSP